jgi:C-terminal processing protease CtpA/Prc
MEAKADALVIDLFNNPGGSLLQVYTLASMLSEKPLTVPRHQVTLDRHEVVGYAVLQSQMATITTEKKAAEYRAANAEALGGYPFTLREVAQFRCYAERLIAEFNAAAGCIKVLTEPLALLGIETVRPSELATFSKPLFVLVNELDFSGGDFFPAILQDSKAATIVGVATAGAGGYIMEMNYFNPFGIGGLSLTASLAVRANGDFIENKGVEPDVDLALTAKDLQGGYRDLRKTINKIVASRLG